MRRLGSLAKGFGALVLLVCLVVGVPWALVHYVGWPLPRAVPSWAQFTGALDRQGIPDQVLIKALACAVWLTWTVLVAAVLAEALAAGRGRRARRLKVAGPVQSLIGPLVAAIVVALAVAVPRPGPGTPTRTLSTALGTRRPVPITAVVAADVVPTPAASSPAPAAPNADEPPTASPPAGSTYVVEPGDTLWGIATRELGDPLRWSEIFALNQGRAEPGGATFSDPHWIYAGWTLLLPAIGDTPAPPAAPAVSPAPPAEPAPATAPASPQNGNELSPPATHTVRPRTRPRPAGHQEASSRRTETGGPGTSIELPSGAWVGAAFAAGVASALAIERLRRRRRHRPGPPAPGRAAGEPVPPPLRALLAARRAPRTAADDAVDARPVDPASEPAVLADRHRARAEPNLIEVSAGSDGPVRLDLAAYGTIAVTGPWAERAVRAWIGALITRAGPYGAEVLASGILADRLFPGVDLDLRRTSDTAATLRALEAAVIGRVRRLEEADLDDVAAYRTAHPGDPFPILVVLVEQTSGSLAARWRRPGASARLGVTVLVVDPDTSDPGDHEAQVTTADDGTVAGAYPAALATLLGGTRLFGFDAEEGRALLGPVAESHTELVEEQLSDAGPAPLSGGPAVARPDPPVRQPDEPWPFPEPRSDHRPAPIRVRLFGPVTVEAWGETVATGLRTSAYELLAWFCLRPEGASLDLAVDALWPDAEPGRGRERCWTVLGNLRARLRPPTERPDLAVPDVIAKVGEHYRPQADQLDVDLWRFEAALGDAAGARGTETEITSLERALSAYGGELCQGADYLWVEPDREDLHRRALDAAVRLAERRDEQGQPEEAVAALQRAADIDPICESVACLLMLAQAAAGRSDAVRHTWRRLSQALAELDLDPEPATTALYRSLTETGRPVRSRSVGATR